MKMVFFLLKIYILITLILIL